MAEAPWHVLVIDGSARRCGQIVRLLQEGAGRNCGCTAVVTGAEGLELLRRADDMGPDCLVIAEDLPDMEVYEFLAAMGSEEGPCAHPVVVVTEGDGQKAAGLLRAGAQETIGEGWMTAESLAQTVNNAIVRVGMDVVRLGVERELEEDGMFLKRVLDNLFAFVGVLLPDGTLVDVNEATLVRSGLRAEQVVGKKFWNCYWWSYSKEASAKVRQQCARALRGETVRYDVQVAAEDGELIWVDYQLAPLYDGEGVVTHLVPSGMEITDRKRVERELRTEEARFRKTFENAAIGMAHVGTDGRWLRVNGALCAMLGYSREELQKRTFGDITHPDDLAGDLEQVDRLLSDEIDTYALEKRYFHRDGSIVWGRLTVSLLRDGKGKPLYFIVAVMDITRKMAVEEELERQRRFVERVTAVMPSVLYVFHMVEKRNVWLNPRLRELLNYTEQEIAELGSDLLPAIFHPDDLKRVERHYEVLRTLEDGATAEIEYRLRNREGEWRWFQSYDTPFTRDDQGRVLEIIGMATEVTARKLARDTLRISEERLALGVQVAGLALGEIDFETGKNRLTAEAARMFGLGDEPMVVHEEDFQTTFHPDDYSYVMEEVARSLDPEHGGWFSLEHRVLRDGEVAWIRARTQVFFDGEGESRRAVRAVMAALDVTAEKIAEEELLEAARRKDEFLAMLGHELRNPLGAIRHAVRLRREAADDLKVQAWAEGVIDRQSVQLVRMVDDLLDVARITRGKIELQTDRVNLVEVLERAAAAAAPQMELRKQEFAIDARDEGLWVEGDSARLEQVFGNLLSNAVKYTQEGGHISLTGRREGPQVVVSVKDDGMGIGEDLMPYLFDLFRQAETSLDRSQGGLGIGLTVVKSLVELHGGSVSIASAGEGRGSVFTVTLPTVESKPENGPEELEKAEVTDGHARKVLVVDDHEDAAIGLGRLLEKRGFEVRVCHDGGEALQLAASFEPQVFLLDLGLPGLDGFGLARALRQDPRFQSARMVAISGYAQESDQARSKEAGFDHHFAKPLNVRKLMEVIDEEVGTVNET